MGTRRAGDPVMDANRDASGRFQAGSTVNLGRKRLDVAILHLKHGHSVQGSDGLLHVSPTYSSWAHMRGRVLNAKDDAYPNYGGRGVTICEDWDSFENFLADMGERPDGQSLDRIDNDVPDRLLKAP